MDANAQARVGAGKAHRVVKRGRVGQQGGAGQDAVLMGADDAIVDGRGQAEVVGIDNEPGYFLISTYAMDASGTSRVF